MTEQFSSGMFETPYKFNGKELDEETGYYYYGARYMYPRSSIWLSTDPLFEKYPNVNPYTYCLQNPIKLIDPTGMAVEDPPLGFETNHGAIHKDSSGEWIYNKNNNTWEGQNGSSNIENAIQLKDVVLDKYSRWEGTYFDRNSYGKGENHYSPYIPDGIGLSGGGSFGGFSASFSLAVNERNQIDLFYSFDGTFRLHNIFSKPWGASATFDFYDNNGRTGNIFDNITGDYRTLSGSYILSGAYSYPIDKKGVRDEQGVTKTSFGLGSPSAGYGGGKTHRFSNISNKN